MSASGDVSTEATLLLSASSRVYLASIQRMSVEEEGVTSMCLVSSLGTPACRHNTVIKSGKGKEVCLLLAFMAISYSDGVEWTHSGWHYGAANEAKPETSSNTQIPLLYGDLCLDPPQGGIGH
ncbi:hypothetical protein H5410_002188 [Solanum commersonii]|uniref:Uncharacterized protein n=1 Tax=Solanum commersonii TaxID=4109 RepID=A0A9J6B266_SOLCO|nr:hypothetical protein H5410_002188 [Solanum commersonii]